VSEPVDPVRTTPDDPAREDEVAAGVVGAFPDADAGDGDDLDGVAAAVTAEANPDPAAATGPDGDADLRAAAARAYAASGAAHARPADPGGAEDGVAEGPQASPAEAEDDPRTRDELLVAAREAERQRDEYLDDLRRARAEFDNFRRRTGREAASARDAGRGDVASALLDVLDDLDRTLAAAEDSADPGLAKGVSLVAEKLSGTLASLGLIRLEPLGDPFDPAEHEAVQQVPADEPLDPPVVDSTLRPGYRLGDRVLRPAMVVVRG
jgi:molecular chaperone GrpE